MTYLICHCNDALLLHFKGNMCSVMQKGPYCPGSFEVATSYQSQYEQAAREKVLYVLIESFKVCHWLVQTKIADMRKNPDISIRKKKEERKKKEI